MPHLPFPDHAFLAAQAYLGLIILCLGLSLVSRVVLARFILAGLLSVFGKGFTTAYQLLRTPGNITHELAHAVGFLLAGVKVLEVRFWFNDPAARGYVRSGPAYAPWGFSWLARLVSAPAPLLAGALVLQTVAIYLKVPGNLAEAVRQGAEMDAAALTQGLGALWHWASASGGAPRAIGFVLLAVSLGVELAPSGQDVKLLAVPASVLGLLLVGLGYASRSLGRDAGPLPWLDGVLAHGFQGLMAPISWALLTLLGLALVLLPLRLLVGLLRRR